MSGDQSLGAIKRKAGAGRPPPEIGRASSASVLRAAIAQAAEDSAGMVAAALSVGESRATLGAACADLPEKPLLALIAAPSDAAGLAVMDAGLLAALIEAQTTGRVSPYPAEPRPPTRTDRLFAAQFLDRLLELFEDLLAEVELPLAETVAGFRFQTCLADERAIEMTLDDIGYRQFALSLDLGQGAKQGALWLYFPAVPHAARGGEKGALWQSDFRKGVMQSRASFVAILGRICLPFDEVAGLRAGSHVLIDRAQLQQVSIEDMNGKRVAAGSLGQVDGFRAIRIRMNGDGNADGVPEAVSLAVARNPEAGPNKAPIAEPEPLPALADLPDLPALEDFPELAALDQVEEFAPLPDLPALDG